MRNEFNNALVILFDMKVMHWAGQTIHWLEAFVLANVCCSRGNPGQIIHSNVFMHCQAPVICIFI